MIKELKWFLNNRVAQKIQCYENNRHNFKIKIDSEKSEYVMLTQHVLNISKFCYCKILVILQIIRSFLGIYKPSKRS
jgi:hypothetical protein